MSEERAHRKYSPSQAERFSVCYGSNALIARVPKRPSSEYAIEGTKAHLVLDAALRNGVRDAQVAHREHSEVFFEHLNDSTNEFYLSIQIALDYVYSILDANPDAVMWLETFVDPPVENAPGEAGGYCDIAIYLPSQRTLYVIDYKHGAGVAKDAEGNPQPLQYGAGFLYEDNARVDVDAIDTVVLCIVQPRAFHVDGAIREVSVTPYAVWEYLENLDAIIAKCEEPDAPLDASSEDACRFCDARAECPAREAKAVAVANSAFKQIGDVTRGTLPDVNAIDMQRLGAIRFHAKTLRDWLNDVEERCYELARQGFTVPGSKLVEAEARRKWYGDENDLAFKIAAMMGEPDVSKVFTSKLIPLTTAEKLVVEAYKRRVGTGRKRQAAAEAKQAFAFLTLKQSSGSLTLVDEDDPRPGVNGPQQAFTQITGLLPPPLQT